MRPLPTPVVIAPLVLVRAGTRTLPSSDIVQHLAGPPAQVVRRLVAGAVTTRR